MASHCTGEQPQFTRPTIDTEPLLCTRFRSIFVTVYFAQHTALVGCRLLAVKIDPPRYRSADSVQRGRTKKNTLIRSRNSVCRWLVRCWSKIDSQHFGGEENTFLFQSGWFLLHCLNPRAPRDIKCNLSRLAFSSTNSSDLAHWYTRARNVHPPPFTHGF